jgi:hypothetical protein
MTQFTCKGVKQINNRISFKHLYHSYLSAFFISAGVPNGEFSEILIAARIYIITYLFTLPPLRGSLPRKSLISRMDWVSCAGDINLPHTDGWNRGTWRKLSQATDKLYLWYNDVSSTLHFGFLPVLTPFPPARSPPTKKSSTIKSWPTFCDQYFWKFPIRNSRAEEKCREIRICILSNYHSVGL